MLYKTFPNPLYPYKGFYFLKKYKAMLITIYVFMLLLCIISIVLLYKYKINNKPLIVLEDPFEFLIENNNISFKDNWCKLIQNLQKHYGEKDFVLKKMFIFTKTNKKIEKVLTISRIKDNFIFNYFDKNFSISLKGDVNFSNIRPSKINQIFFLWDLYFKNKFYFLNNKKF